MTSILTNNGAMVALQTLKGINSDLETTQAQISTGKKVGNAADNAAVWAIAKTMESDVAGFNKIGEGLATAESTVATARDASEQIVEKLKEVRTLVASATNETLNADQRTMIENDITSLQEEMESIVASAQFNGVNLVGAGAANVKVLSSLNRAAAGTVTPGYITVTATDLSVTSGKLAEMANIDVTDNATSETSLGKLDTMIKDVVLAASKFGTAQNKIESQASFVSKLADNMKSGIGAMVDADMEAASARLKALQTQQQLGVQSLSIANQAPQSIMALFR